MSNEPEVSHETARKRQVALCEALGIDPDRTTSIAVTYSPDGDGGVVNWEGRQDLTSDQLSAVLAAVNAAAAEDSGAWRISPGTLTVDSS